MRTLKAMFLCVMAVCAMAALVVPAGASASNWTKNGSPLGEFQEPYWSGSEGLAAIAGSFNFSGGAACEAAGASIDFPNNELKEFGISSSSCKTTGTLKSLGCKAVKSVTSKVQPLFAPVLAGGSRYVNIGVELNYLFEGGAFCPKEVMVSGILKGTPDNAAKIKTLTLSGTLTSSVKGIEAVITGTLSLYPAEHYGIMGTTQVDINGYVDFAYGSCSKSSGAMGFGPNGTANIETFNWSNCIGAGTFHGCTVTVASDNLPWAAQDEGSSIKVANMQITETITGCVYKGSYHFSGAVTLTPDKASAISEVHASGSLSSGVLIGTVSGELAWSPAGVYGL